MLCVNQKPFLCSLWSYARLIGATVIGGINPSNGDIFCLYSLPYSPKISYSFYKIQLIHHSVEETSYYSTVTELITPCYLLYT